MRLSTTYKLILLSTLCVVVSGCSHTFDENNNYVSKDVLHKMPMELMLVDRNDLADRGVSISVADNRPFKDTGSASEDSSEYFIDLNQDDTKESREKTIGYILTTFTGLSNIANYHLPRSVILFSTDQFSTLSRSSDLLHSDHSFFSF